MSSLFDAVEMAPRDPILGLNEQFAADPNPAKVNLGVGVYYDENGKLPLLRCVRDGREDDDGSAAGARLPADRRHRRLRRGGPGARLRRRQRRAAKPAAIATVQAVGGTGGAEGRRRLPASAQPGRAGADQRPELGEPPRAVRQAPASTVETYPYYDAGQARRRLRRHARRARTRAAPGTIVVLHACCHNPTGCDLTPAQWDAGRSTLSRPREPGALPRHGLPGLRRRHRRRRRAWSAVLPRRRPRLLRRRPASRRASRSTASASARCRSSARARKRRRAC